MKKCNGVLFSALLFVSLHPYSQTLDECLVEQLKLAGDESSVSDVKQKCIENAEKDDEPTQQPMNIAAKRIILEREAQDNPFVITPHKQNYILPISYMDDPNDLAWQGVPGVSGKVLENEEAVFQISIKIPISPNGVFYEHDGFYFGYTVKSYWQVYNSDYSRPFRETNYNPEIFYFTPTPFKFWGGDTAMVVGFEHQSNGRAEPLSRSWDRIYASFMWADERLAMSFRPWYRIQEDSDDDDNPDISDYMGYFEYKIAYKFDNGYETSGLFRRNFGEGNGAVEIGFSFPLYYKLRGYVQYFNGYGDNLLDYNHNLERIGIGIMLTDYL